MPSPHQFARKKFSQNFLRDESIIDAIVSYLALSADDAVVEIGPGLGALTAALLAKTQRYEGIELDERCVEHLRRRWSDICIHPADVLKFDWTAIENPAPWRLVGNLPYQISSPCLLLAAELRDSLRDACFMLQKEMVDRLLAKPGSKAYGRLTVMVGYHFEVYHVVDAPASAFEPAPKVDSAVCYLKPYERALTADDPAIFAEVVATAFQQRRKMVRRVLGHWLKEEDFASLSLEPTLRPENLTIDDYVRISNHIGRSARR